MNSLVMISVQKQDHHLGNLSSRLVEATKKDKNKTILDGKNASWKQMPQKNTLNQQNFSFALSSCF